VTFPAEQVVTLGRDALTTPIPVRECVATELKSIAAQQNVLQLPAVQGLLKERSFAAMFAATWTSAYSVGPEGLSLASVSSAELFRLAIRKGRLPE